jgi:hypothetical protein
MGLGVGHQRNRQQGNDSDKERGFGVRNHDLVFTEIWNELP